MTLGWRDIVQGEKQAVRLFAVRFRREILRRRTYIRGNIWRRSITRTSFVQKIKSGRNDTGKRYVNSLMDQTLFEECLGSLVSLRLIDDFFVQAAPLAGNYSCQQRENRRCLHSREITSVICETLKYRGGDCGNFTQHRIQKLLKIILRKRKNQN